MPYRFEPIGRIRSPFKEKFGIPRQAGLIPEARGRLELFPPYDRAETVRGLEEFSHLWIIFLFHAVADQGWKPLVRPPRLGGNRKVGVFATRAPFRPNPIGLSVVELAGIERREGRVALALRGVDLLDGTPVLDIKPYVPYADALPIARHGFAPKPPEASLAVDFSHEAAAVCAASRIPELRELITRLIRLDPRPAYRHGGGSKRIHGMRLYDFDVKWRVTKERAVVVGLEPTREE